MASGKWKILILMWAWGREGKPPLTGVRKAYIHTRIFIALLQCSWKRETDSDVFSQTWCGQSLWNPPHVTLLTQLSASLWCPSWFRSWTSFEWKLLTVWHCAELCGLLQTCENCAKRGLFKKKKIRCWDVVINKIASLHAELILKVSFDMQIWTVQILLKCWVGLFF